jgi:RNA polymerase sigma-70 factor, ECF subfamily
LAPENDRGGESYFHTVEEPGVKQHMTARLEEDPPATLLYEQHARPILAYLRLHAPSWEDAEDVLQEVFLATIGHQQLLALPEQDQLAWLVRVAQHKLVDHYRRRRLRVVLPLEPVADQITEEERLSPEQVLLGQEAQHELWEAVKQLPETQQQVIYLRFVSDLRYPHIALLLDKREDTVRKLLSRALHHLRKCYPQPREEHMK